MSTKVEFGVIQKLLVTEVTQLGQAIFVQLDTPEGYQVQDLSREIEHHISKQNQDQLNFEPGSRCYACASDGVLYRALVVAKNTRTKAVVYFTDYGNSEEVEISDMYPPTGSYFDLPAQALCCTLSDFIPKQSQWSDTIHEILVEKLLNQEVYGMFRSVSSNPHPYSDAVLQDSGGGHYPCYNVTLFQDEVGAVSHSSMLVSIGLGQFAICNENVSVGTTAKVFVAFSDSPGRFWLQLSAASPTLEIIAVALSDEAVVSSLNPLARESVYTGVACCVVYAEDGVLYRANIIEIKGSKVEVQFVDYGNSTTVSTSELLELPPSLATIPAQAIQCCLEGVRPVKKDWIPESCDAFSDGTLNVELDADFVDELTPEVFTVVLRNPETGATISEMLVASGCATSSSAAPILRGPPKKKLDKGAIQQSLPKDYTLGSMEVGQSYEIIITHLESPSVVWAQLTAHEAVFRDMMSNMSTLFKNPSSIPGLEDPNSGQPCAAQFADDKMWYRGRIKEIDATSKRAKVVFVDFGNTDNFNISALKRLQPELILLPTQAVSFSMNSLIPADGGIMWPMKTISTFMKMTSSGVLQCEVVEQDSDGYPAVRLKDGRGRDIGEELVKMRLACWKGEERKSRSYQQNRPSRDSGANGSRDGSMGGSRSKERNINGGGSRGSSVCSSATSSRDTSAPGNRHPSQSQISPHGNQQSSLHTKKLSPIHTGAGPRPKKQQHFSSLTLEVGKTYKMTVIYVDSLQDFHVQLNEHEPKLTALMDQIATYCSSDKARMPDNLAIGQPVLAQFTDDQGWYRALISKRNQGISVVTFVDYGNQDTLQDSSLVAIPPDFLSLPAQAIRCSLDGVGVQVSPEEAKTAFNDLTLEQEAGGVVKSVLQDSSGPIYTIDLSLSDGSKPIMALVEGGHISIPRATLSNLSPSSSPTVTEVKVPSFPVNTHIDVCLSYIESPANFFVQLLENTDQLEQLTQEMNEIYLQMSERDEVLFSRNEGVFCAAKFSEDGVWYRARIISMGGTTAKVRFVDYGNEEEVPASNLKSLRVQFKVEACLAIQCHLDGFPSEIATSPGVVEKFSEFIATNKQFIANFLKPFSSYSASVPIQLFDTSLPQTEQNVASLLQGIHLNAGQNQPQNKLAQKVAPVETKPSSKSTLPQIQPSLNTPMEYTVTHVESPSEIYCQPVSSTPVAEALLGELFDFYAEQNSGVKVERPEIGIICAAPFTDGSWYRVRVTAVKSGKVSVQYLDYGNSADVSTTELRVLDPKFLSQPPHALRCSLNGIQPMENLGDGWTSDCCAALGERILDQNCTVKVLSVRNDICSVEMALAGSNVAQSLLSERFAVETSPPKAPSATAARRKDETLAIPPFSATVGSEIEVFVTFCDFPKILYCQPTQLDERFDHLTQEIQQHCESAAATVVHINDVNINDIVLAQYSEDNSWYRAQAKEIAKDSLKVLFVDYGNSEETKSLCAISAKFCSLPAQAAPCTMLNSDNYSLAPDKSGSSFNDHFTSDDSGFTLRFVDVVMTGEKSVVQLTRLSDGLGALEHACGAGFLVSKIGASVGGYRGQEVVTMEAILPTVVVETNSREDGFISHLESPSSFWIQFACNESELDSLTEQLAAIYGIPENLPKLPSSQPGQVCCAQFSSDMLWYRSVIHSVNGDQIKVHFVDYGNSEVLSPIQIRLLKKDLLEIPVQAVHCSLIGIIPPTGATWSAESISGFSNFVLDNAVTAEFVNESAKGPWSVMLTCQNKDVATAMMDEGFAVSKLQPQTKPSSEPSAEISPNQENILNTPLESPNVTIPELVLREGENYEVYISHMSDSPSEFYCQLMNNEDTVEELMASVSDFYSDKSPPATLEVGRYCVAKYSVNDAWHRAKIIEINRNGGEEMVTVQFVDFGNCEVVSLSRVLGLSPALAALANQAVCCSLVGDPNLQLPDQSIARFLQINVDLCYRILVIGILENGRYLVELSNFNGESLNSHILNVAFETQLQTSESSTLSFKTLSYPVSSTIDVYVSFLNSPSSFYCQPLPLAADLEAMMEELSGAVAGGGLDRLESVCPRVHCLAQFSDDNEWYRARVESVSDNGTDVVVHFVDYGNSEATTLSSLLQCPPSLFQVPVQALHCSVFDSSSTVGVEWSEDAIKTFRELLGDEPLSLTVSKLEIESGMCVCTLSSNGSPIDFSPLLSSLVASQHKKLEGDLPSHHPQVVAPGNQEVIESEQPYASSASSSSLPPPTVVAVTTSEGKTSEHSAGTSDDGRSSHGLLPGGATAKPHMNFSTLALKGSSHASGEDLSDTESSEEASDQGGGEGEPLIKAPFTLTLSVQEGFDAIVVYVESPSFLFLQRLDCQAELDKLSNEIEQYCASFAEKQHQEVFQEGDFVLAQYSDQVWYRAKVVEAGADASCQVFFIDFGNSETISPDKMVMCPENYLELPCQAIACSLSNVPRRDSWPEEYKMVIDNQFSGREIKVKVVHPALKGMRPTVNIEDKETGADMAQVVLNRLHDECEQGNISNYVIPEEPEEVETPENTDQDTPKVDPATIDQPAPSATELTQQATRYMSVPQRDLEIGLTCDVYVVSCESPHSFFVQLENEAESLEEMTAALICNLSAYENVGSSQMVLAGPPTVGDYVCSQFSEDLKWYRAKVLGFDHSDPAHVELLFIDYGNREMGKVANLRTLSPSLPSRPPFAIECFLAGIEPPEGQGIFGADASEHVLELTGHGETVCKIEIQFSDSAGHYGVNLMGGEGVNVAQSLIDGNMATALQDTPTTAASNSEFSPEQSEPILSGAPPPDQSELPLSAEEPLAISHPVKVEEDVSDRFATSYPNWSLEEGSTHNAVLTSITSLDVFHCQLTDQTEQLEELMERIALRGYQIGDSDLAVTQPCKGLAVCACYTEEDAWYRAQVNDLLPQDRVTVTYVDYGNSEEVDVKRVKKLEKEFADAVAPLVVTCSMAPLTDRDIDPLRPRSADEWTLEWPEKCLTHFQEMIGEEGEVKLVIGEKGSAEGEDGSGVRVRVFVSGEEGEIDVRKSLVETFFKPQAAGQELLLQNSEEADGGYGDSVIEEGGEGEVEGTETEGGDPSKINLAQEGESPSSLGEVTAERSKTSGKNSSFEDKLEQMVKEVAGLALAEAQRDLTVSKENDPIISSEDW